MFKIAFILCSNDIDTQSTKYLNTYNNNNNNNNCVSMLM